MKLKKIQYSSPNWELENIYFNDVSLIVGRNSVGKSQTLNILNDLVAIILQTKELNEYDYFFYSVVFCDYSNDSEMIYSFACQKGQIVSESLKNNSQLLINRNEDSTIYFNDTINPPSNKLTINVRRDIKLYPYVEKIINWAENSYGILFNKIMPGQDSTPLFNIMAKCENLIFMFEKLTDETKQVLLDELNALNYSINKIEIVEFSDKFKVLHIEEKDVETFLWEGMLSQGMLRTIFTLVLTYYISFQKKETQTIVIDDFCEGLDYDRSIKLGKYLYSYCIDNKIQLITTSNDSFLMDVVDLKYWNILQRNGKKVTAINMYNSPELFDDFEFTGLSNFDLFSSDFIARHKK